MQNGKFGKLFGFLCKSYKILLSILIWYIILDFFVFKYCLHVKQPFFIDDKRSKYMHPYINYVNSDIAASDPKSIYFGNRISLFENVADNDVKIAFFAGSTGLMGEPLIVDKLEEYLTKKLNKNVRVINFSAHGAVHAQFMHALPDDLLRNFKPDIIVFYCGNNELSFYRWYDPRPGYPQYFPYTELPEWQKFMINYSALASSLFIRKPSIFNPVYDKYSKIPRDEIVKMHADNFFDIIEFSKHISSGIKSNKLSKPLFLAFYQPYKNGDDELTDVVRTRIKNYDYIYDFHDAYDDLPPDVWDDVCHVTGEANIKMAKMIGDTIYGNLKKNPEFPHFMKIAQNIWD